jgi:hypothetical protein
VLVLDTSVALALLNAGDPEHDRCVRAVDAVGEELVVPVTVLPELDYWVLNLLGPEAWQVFVEDLERGGYRLEQIAEPDLARAAELERTYASLGLGLVDASVIAVCERLGETKVATLDRRHFTVVRPRHCDALLLVPE